MNPVRAWLATPGPSGGVHAQGAIAVVELLADSPDALDKTLGRITGRDPIAPGQARLRDLAGADRGVVARWSPTRASLMPHAGAVIVRALLDALPALGAPLADPHDAPLQQRWPEARDFCEAAMLEALSLAPSPRAVDTLLRAADHWRQAGGPPRECLIGFHPLDRLIHPPLVVAVGPPNVGKSSLLNALARRDLAVVADEPGTTRDHVGAMLELDGLVVRWVDTPGFRAKPDPAEQAALDLAEPVIRAADVVLSCADAASTFVHAPRRRMPWTNLFILGGIEGRILPVGTRADLGPAPGAETLVSARTGQGLADLAAAVRRRLVPDRFLDDPSDWRYWHALRRPG